jgi:hypothetical protein
VLALRQRLWPCPSLLAVSLRHNGRVRGSARCWADAQNIANGQSMSEPAWEFQHSVECNAPRKFAWGYWTNVLNWNDPPAKFHLDGPFEAGSRLTTKLPDQTWRSIIRHVNPEHEAIIEMQLQDAALSFDWRFEELSKERTRITQRLALRGANAKSFVAQVSVFEKSIPDGMKKVVAAIEGAQIGTGNT